MKFTNKITAQITELWIRYHWPILASLGFLSALFESVKLAREPAILNAPLTAFELLLQGIILPVLLLTLQRVEDQRNAAVNALSLLDALVYQLNKTDNWDELFEVIGQFTRNVIPLAGICLLTQDRNSNRFDFEFVRVFDTGLQLGDVPDSLKLSDTECYQPGAPQTLGLRLCNCPLKLQNDANKTLYHRYCLPLTTPDSTLGVLHLYLPASYKLSKAQRDFLAGIEPEIVLSISNANLKRSNALREAAFETERMRLASDLHDTLGQDLAYLRNKLDQLVQVRASRVTISKDELNQMLIVADAANQTVRNILSITHSNPENQTNDWLLAYAKMIGERAGFDVTLESRGLVQALSPHTQFQVFLIFREILANIEKHASARKVVITLVWSEQELNLGINDDGRGFLTDHLDKRDHFGLTIMETRTRELNGQLSIISAPSAGTKITIKVPISREILFDPDAVEDL